MKYADKLGVKFVLIIGEEELQKGKFKVRNMENGEEFELELDSNLEGIMNLL